jgi:hypothetical protein
MRTFLIKNFLATLRRAMAVASLGIITAAAQTLAISGNYSGQYSCAQGETPLKLSIRQGPKDSIEGVFTFYLPKDGNPKGDEYSYTLQGKLDASTNTVALSPVQWQGAAPAGFAMVGLTGKFDPAANTVTGRITNSACGAFKVARTEPAPANAATPAAGAKAYSAAQSVELTGLWRGTQQSLTLKDEGGKLTGEYESRRLVGHHRVSGSISGSDVVLTIELANFNNTWKCNGTFTPDFSPDLGDRLQLNVDDGTRKTVQTYFRKR